MPTSRSVADIKSKLLHPALTSHFEVKIPIPTGLQSNPKYLESNGLGGFASGKQDTLNLLCSETILPGSNIGTMDITGDYHGVTQRHANRRIYDDRIDMTFYVDADNYLPIRYFEVWMKYVVGESVTEVGNRPGSVSPNYFYRLNYPDLYIAKQGLEVTKFERTGKGSSYTGKVLTYKFVNAFPISIASMPVSYDASSLLKCTVSFSYIRYILLPLSGGKDGKDGEPAPIDASKSNSSAGDVSSPNYQAAFNNYQFNASAFETNLNLNLGQYTTTGGVNYSAASAAGNAIDTKTAYSPDSNLNFI